MATREQIMTAFFNVVANSYEWQNDLNAARRLKLWGDVPLDQRPAVYQFEGGTEDWKWTNKIIPIITIPVEVFAYINAKDENDPTKFGAIQLNKIIDSIKTALTPVGIDAVTGRFTIGGMVDNVRIMKIFKDPGDLDGDGMMKMSVDIVLPSN